MQISCIDQSNGKLFYAHNFLTVLNDFEHEVILNLPENFRYIYGTFFDNFSQIKIKSVRELSNNLSSNIIFSNYDNLKSMKDIEKSLIYPVLKNSEVDGFHKWLNQIKSGLKPNVMPIETIESNNSIIQPESKWALDLLRRQINDHPLKGISFLISAGPTIEDIDPVRYLTNRSSGKMGIALARAAYINGADVQLIYGPGGVEPPCYLPVQKIRSAENMYNAVMAHFEKCNIYIGSAAIADFTPVNIRNEKIKKKDGFSDLILQPTKDILKEISTVKKNQILIGFSVETTDTIENSKAKLINKNLDLVVVNNPREKGAAFDTNTNVVSIIFKDGRIESWPIMSKLDVATKLMHIIIKMLND